MSAVYSEKSVSSAFENLNTSKSELPKASAHALWASMAALLLVAVFLIVISFIVIDSDRRSEEIRLKQSTDLVVQTLEARILGTAELLQKTSMRLLSTSGSPDFSLSSSELAAVSLMNERREILELAVIDENGKIRQSWTSTSTPAKEALKTGENVKQITAMPLAQTVDKAFALDLSTITTLYTRDESNRIYANLVSPSLNRRFVLAARIDFTRLLADAVHRTGNSEETSYRFEFLVNGPPLSSEPEESSFFATKPITYDAHVSFLGMPFAEDVRLCATSYDHALFTTNRVQVFAVMGLAGMLLLSVALIFYYQRQQHRAHRLLSAEYLLRRAMAESSVVGLCVTDMDGTILYVNETFQKIVGYDAKELIGQRPPYPYWSDDLGEKAAARLMEETPSAQPIDFEARRPNGECFYAEMRLSPLLDEHKNKLGVIGALYDVTPQVLAKMRLEAANDRFTRVLESMNSAVVVLSASDLSEQLFSNRSYDASFGKDDAGHFLRLLTESQAQKLKEPVFDDAHGRWWEIRTQEILWTKGEKALLVIAGDITASRELELAREAQQRRAESTQRLVTMGEMASSLAHELNQPLAAIANYAGGALSRLEAQTLTPSQTHTVFTKIESLAQRAGRIILRIRGFSKKTDPVLEPVSASQIVEETMELARIQSKKASVSVTVAVPETLPRILGDSVMLEQLLLNLIKNAIEAVASQRDELARAAAQGANSENATQSVPATQPVELLAEEIWLEDALHTAVPQGEVFTSELALDERSSAARAFARSATHRIRFLVVDHGPGISDEEKAQLFDAFYSTKSEGMGMGLNICRTIAEVHGGRIEIADTAGGGTTFSFTVPVADENADDFVLPESHRNGGLSPGFGQKIRRGS